jgi:hypothetical protein
MRCQDCGGLLAVLKQWITGTLYGCRSCHSEYEWRKVSTFAAKARR